MKVEKFKQGEIERRILIGLIVNPLVLGRISSKWEKDMFRSKASNLIAQWCVDYYKKYQKPPQRAIEGLFEAWASENQDEEVIKSVEGLLTFISGEYTQHNQELNPQYIIDEAAKHFNIVKLTRLADTIQGHIDSGHVEKAVEVQAKYNHVEMGIGTGIDILRDMDAILESFKDSGEVLVKYPGALGGFFRKAMIRESLFAFMAAEKGYKSFYLSDLAWRAMQQGRKVAFFEVGDMSQNQIMERFIARGAGRPREKGVTRYPIAMSRAPHDKYAQIDFQDRQFVNDMTDKQAVAYMAKIAAKLKSQEQLLRLSCHPSDSINVLQIQSILATWELEGWFPDVIVIDYADILAPIPGSGEGRDQINKTWKAMRALSIAKRCLVATATQADAASYDQYLLSRKNFSEDKRKFAHVLGMVGINAQEQEKEVMASRLNYLELRNAKAVESECVFCAGCLDIANPCVLSAW